MDRRLLAWGILVAFVLVLLAPLASSLPDGLERVAEDHGFAERASALTAAPLPDYSVPGVGQASLSTVLAGLAGVVAVFLLTLAAGRLLCGRGRAEAAAAGRGER